MNLIEELGIQTISVTSQQVILELKVSAQHLQPFGYLHGGISCVLAETAASIGGNANLNLANQVAVGLDIQTTHLNAVQAGSTIQTVATPVKIGRQIQTWTVLIVEKENRRQVSLSQVNLFVKKN